MASQSESVDKRCPSCAEPVQAKWKCCPYCVTSLECPSHQTSTHSNLPDRPNLDIDSDTDVNEIDTQHINSIEFGSASIDELVPVEPPLVNAGSGVETNLNEANTLNEFSVVQALKDMAETFKKEGLPKAKELIEEDLDSWKKCTIKIGMVGGSGSGKSSFINAILGLDPTHEHAAKVGVTETTQCEKKFSHPTYPNFEFWDLPGVGTPKFKKDDYLKTIKVERYDFFIVTSQARFSENDAWLAKIVAKDKGFYFVRTMIDLELIKDQKAKRHLHSPALMLDEIRSECMNQLKNEGVLEPHVFLVNNYEPGKYDFNRIFSQLKKDAPQSKKQALVLCFPAMSPEIIDDKYKILRARTLKVAILSSAAAAIPIPGTGSAVDLFLLEHETKFYREQLGTDDKSLERIAKHLNNMRLEDLKTKVDLKSSVIFKSRLSFLSFCSAFLVSESIDNASLFLIPVIGSFISAVTSYPSSVIIQRRLLKQCADEAYRVLEMNPSYNYS